MARFAIIQNGTVANVVQAAPAFAASQGWVAVTSGVGIGWTYDGSTFSAPAAQPDPVPPLVTRYQFKAAVRAAGQGGALATYINGLTNGAKEEWTDRRFFRRDSALINNAATALGFTANQVDNLFRQAASIDD